MSFEKDFEVDKKNSGKNDIEKLKECKSEKDKDYLKRKLSNIDNILVSKKKEDLISLKSEITFEIAQLYCKIQQHNSLGINKLLRDSKTLERLISELKSGIIESVEISKYQVELQQKIFENEWQQQFFTKNHRDLSPQHHISNRENADRKEIYARLQLNFDRNKEQIFDGLMILEHFPKLFQQEKLVSLIKRKTAKLDIINKSLFVLKLNKKIQKNLKTIEELKKQCAERDVHLHSFQSAFELLFKEKALSNSFKRENFFDLEQSHRRSSSRLKNFLKYNTHNSLTPVADTGKNIKNQKNLLNSSPLIENIGFSSKNASQNPSFKEKNCVNLENKFSSRKCFSHCEPPTFFNEETIKLQKNENNPENSFRNLNRYLPQKTMYGVDRSSIRLEYPLNSSITFDDNPLNTCHQLKNEISPYKSPTRKDFLNDLESSQNIHQAKLNIDKELNLYSNENPNSERELIIGRSGFSLRQSKEEASTCVQNSQVISHQKQFPEISYKKF